VSDAAQLWLKYVMRLTDPNTMPPTFREALATYLAWGWETRWPNQNRIQEGQGIRFGARLISPNLSMRGTTGRSNCKAVVGSRRGLDPRGRVLPIRTFIQFVRGMS